MKKKKKKVKMKAKAECDVGEDEGKNGRMNKDTRRQAWQGVRYEVHFLVH